MDFSWQTFAAAMTIAVLAGNAGAQEAGASGDRIERTLKQISWFGQSSIRIESDGKTIYIDPLFYQAGDKADLILITHLHQDHYVSANVKALSKKETVVVAPFDLGTGNRVLKPGTEATIAGFRVEAVPAYNIVKTQFHPKSAGNNGYIVTIDGVRLYHAGDTERIPEMKNFNCDIAMVPLGQTFTFTSVDEAVEAVCDTGAKFAIPIHYGMAEGSASDARHFSDALAKKGVTAVILKK